MSDYSNEIVEDFIELIEIVKRDDNKSGITLEQVYSLIEYVNPDIKYDILEIFLSSDGLVEITLEKDDHLKIIPRDKKIIPRDKKIIPRDKKVLLIKELRNVSSPVLSVKQCVDIIEDVDFYGKITLPFKTTVTQKKLLNKNIVGTGFRVR